MYTGNLRSAATPEHVDDLEPSRSGSVFNAHADAERPGIQLLAQVLLHLFNLLRSGVFFGGGPALRQDVAVGQRRPENQRARRQMARRGSVMDERVAFLGFEELSHVGCPDLHLQRRRHAVECLHPLAVQILPVLV